MPLGQGKYWWLDLKPKLKKERDGYRYTRSALRKLGPRSCFAEDDLYTTIWGGQEKWILRNSSAGPFDTEGKPAVEFFSTSNSTILVRNQPFKV